MDLIDKLQEIALRIQKMKEQVETEEATKTAFVMPFLSALGYDIFNPTEVVPEFTADIGTKKGEKVDYCIFQEGKPVVIIECKHWKEKLDIHTSQLHRYFHVTTSRFGILTNGVEYQFFSDLEEPNKMDSKPFFEVNFSNLTENSITELKKFQKESFDIDQIISNASDLKYSKAIKELLAQELKNPTDDFVKYFASRVYTGRITAKIQEQFEYLVQKSSKQLISDLVSDRLKTALSSQEEETKNEISEVEEIQQENQPDEKGVLTTEEELEGFRIVQAILRRNVSLDRVFLRDTKSYCGIILDDNNRKPICRMWFNGGKKHFGTFDKDKNEERHSIDKLEDIYQFEDKILETVQYYD